MSRIPFLKPEEMTERQRAVGAAIASARSGVLRGPFAIWLRNPDIAEGADRLGNLLREGTSVPTRLSELAILVTARHWTAQYEWFAHERRALAAGVPRETVEAIRNRKRPALSRRDEQVTYDLCTELYETRAVRDATYQAAEAELGQMMLIELVTIATFYAMIAMVLVTFQAPVPEGEALPLPP